MSSGSKVILNDTDHLWDEGGNPQWVWKILTRGYNVLFMDRIIALSHQTITWAGTSPAEDIPNSEEIRRAMGNTVKLAARFSLADMLPLPELVSTGYCLAKPSETYIIYSPFNAEVKVDLQETCGRLRVEWMHPVLGGSILDSAIEGGEWRTLRPPFESDSILLPYK